MSRYNNYHKHSHYSSIMSPDSNAKPEDYCKRAVELGHTTVFTTEHGYGGSIFEYKEMCDKYGLKCLFGMEGYIVPNPLEKDNRNYHIVLIPTTNEARRKLNKASSRANKEGYYYKPRLFIDDLLKFDKEELYITTACIAGIIRDKDAMNLIFKPLYEHFKDHLLLEIQSHNNDKQISINQLALKLHTALGLKLIAANDSHYIYETDAKDRDLLLAGKNITYGDENSFILDYPDYDTLTNRFIKQGVFTQDQIKEAIDNTLIFDNCEPIEISDKIKMPTLYPNLTKDERVEKLRTLIAEKFKKVIVEDGITKEELPKYVQAIKEEFKTIEDTREFDTADYFLFNEKLIDLAINKYGGVLTTTGRGSSPSFYINRILGVTTIDRLKTPLPCYPERFASVDRLKTSSPDVDNNCVSQEPFLLASRELLGETHCYPMLAYGTMQEGEAFRNLCRAKGIGYDDMNMVAKDLDKYRNDNKWKDIIDESQKYIGTIVSSSIHPCAYLILSDDIESEIGVLKIGDSLCACITSSEADHYRYLKDDFLVVTVVDIINRVFKLIGQPVMNAKDLIPKIDDKVWKLFEDGITCTLNQADGDWATSLIKQYKPKSWKELSMFNACIRPSFNAWRDTFIARQPYTTGSKELDEVLSSTDHFILYQENLMQYFEWLGVSPAQSIGLIKKISKKKIKPEDFTSLENTLRENWIKRTGSIDKFQETWEMIQCCMAYSFNSPHSLSMALDCLYCAYLKANYPLEYYSTVLSMYSGDMDRTQKLTKELEYFNIQLLDIQFGKSKADYNFDKSTNSIYKGLSSIKYLNAQVAEELYNLSQSKQYQSFPELYDDIVSNTSANSRQVDILITLNYFSMFGNNKKLLEYVKYYNEYNGKKQISTSKTYSLSIERLSAFCGKISPSGKTYSEFNPKALLNELWGEIENQNLTIKEQVKAEVEYVGSVSSLFPTLDDKFYAIVTYKTYNNKATPYVTIRQLNNGNEITARVTSSRVFQENPFALYDIVEIYEMTQRQKSKMINGEWTKTEEMESILNAWRKY